jgi:hypothetical protein
MFDPKDPRTFFDVRWMRPSDRSGYTALVASCVGCALAGAPVIYDALDRLGLIPPSSSGGFLAMSGFGLLALGLSIPGVLISTAAAAWYWLSYRRRYPPAAENSIDDTTVWIAAILALACGVHWPLVFAGGFLMGYPWGLFVFICLLWRYMRTRRRFRRSPLHDAAGLIASVATVAWIRGFFF